MKIEPGLYDHSDFYTVKVVRTSKTDNGKLYALMYFTNNPNSNYGKYHFGMEGKHLRLFLKGYTRRK